MARGAVVGAWAVAAVVVAGAGTAGALSPDPVAPERTSPSPSPVTPSATPRPPLDTAQLAAVQLSVRCGSELEELCPAGSGSVVDSRGLILTNAHVAEPSAPGLVQQYGEEQVGSVVDPPYFVVSLVPEPEADAVPRYRASVVAVDGYADLAVLRVDAELDGSRLTAPVQLTNVPLGSLAETRKDSVVRVIGYPTSGDSLSPTVQRGTVASKPADPAQQVSGAWELNTDAPIHSGNSGGLVVDEQGRLVAVPTYRRGLAEQVFRARAVELARPLLEAAQAGKAYRSPYLVPRTGQEELVDTAWYVSEPEGCGDTASVTEAPGTTTLLYAQVRLAGLAAGQDYRVVILGPDGGEYGRVQRAWEPGRSCTTVTASVAEESELPAGTFEAQVLVGPELTRIGAASIEVVGSD